MKLKKNSLKVKIWGYLIIFSILILAFLWLFQTIFLDSYYEWRKTQELHTTMNNILSEYKKETLLEKIETIAYDSGICIELIENDSSIYTTSLNRNCLSNKDSIIYQQRFIKSEETRKTYSLINPRFNNKTLVDAVKLNENLYIFASISLQPLDSTIDILKSQLLIVTFGVLLLSFVVAYFISKKISNPIIKLNTLATNLSLGKYDTVFQIEEDIEELNELTSTLNKTADELSKTEELRRELLANISHDLKTPLTMIKAYAEMIRDLTYKNKQKREENLNVIIEESDRLNLLVNDILELSKIQAKAVPLKKETFDITKTIQDILKRYDVLIVQENYQFLFEEKEKIMVYADKKRIEQVIYNLINNAINYTGEDKKIIIQIEKKEESIIISISDTGKGIDKKELDFIWDKYYKVDKTHKREAIGSGIGLSIVKNILINHEYQFGVVSKKKKGTTFWFEMKREK